MNAKAPVMFVGHGSPMYALNPGVAGALLQAQTHRFDEVEAILVISAHWLTQGTYLTTASNPATIHDFGGFPHSLYKLSYPAPGSPELARKTIATIGAKSGGRQFDVKASPTRGLDHGVWVPLRFLRPQADIPVLQLSLDATLSSADLVQLGAALASLREQGIAIIASGGVTHNLFDLRMHSTTVAGYATRFEQWTREQVSQRNIRALENPGKLTSDFSRAHPTQEHYLPLLIAIGATDESDQLEVLEGGIINHALSMESYCWND
ncbi:extradiol ring-cleavage dioxygenase III subunit B [Oleiphilus messinensis]|uniref:Extradiol ring-cleavage dioxygenase III subunit B n=1 Tax=Oleiphilus messinensis TaxID=141451 RepID=A0A1Y0I472_9GAMM|nr:class III extradiol ring-cleavage dioxygenase [Oleiphilus messinensis]ARU54325.1 extradiol ring-cleavage dioxygenase III subunit B [Oleiphilus messinensis]